MRERENRKWDEIRRLEMQRNGGTQGMEDSQSGSYAGMKTDFNPKEIHPHYLKQGQVNNNRE